jgi:D-beta-D-heptose 7-phosphate kinase / D-beta-D-heptose 1-phosphate adenosyltransferase
MTNPFAKASIAVLGDLMLDTYVDGSVDRISPEAPVPVLRVRGTVNTMGGASNLAANIASLGAQVYMIGRLGNDEGRDVLVRLAEQAGVDMGHVLQSRHPTTRKTRFMCGPQHIVRVDDEVTDACDDTEFTQLREILRAARKKAATLVISDYAKGMIDQRVLGAARDIWADGMVLADPKPRKTIDYSGVTLLKPNLSETATLLGEGVIAKTDEAAADAAQRLVEKFGLKYALVTRSENGMTLHDGKSASHIRTAAPLRVESVVGAGDTVMAVMACSLDAGMSAAQAAQLAAQAGRLVVAKPGTSVLTWDELSVAA